MNKEDFAYVGCRLLALFYGVKALFDLSTFMTLLVTWKSGIVEITSVQDVMIYYQLIPLCFYFLVAGLLWFGASWIVQFLLPDTDIKKGHSSITLHQVQSVAFATVGILILGWTLPEIGSTLLRIVEAKKFDNAAPITFDIQIQVFLLVLRMLFGIFLVFGSKGLSGLVTRLRAPKFQ